MAHYAQVNSDGIVVQVLVMDNDMETNQGEAACIAWLQEKVSPDAWVKTSYNGNIRKQYAGSGFTYDSDKDKFIAPQPFASWALDSDDDWQAPLAMPSDDKRYIWDEDAYQADNTVGWVEVEVPES
tara:strand:+ start:352 stop:729 length:378 start_codon:yes stop_codon:yes gene_type:complete